MQAIAAEVEKHVEPLAQLEALVACKPLRGCRVEVSKMVEMFRYCAGWADKLQWRSHSRQQSVRVVWQGLACCFTRTYQEQFLSMLESGMRQLSLGDRLDESTEVGPISNARQFQHVCGMVQNAGQREGARVIADATPAGDGFFVAPTILIDLAPYAAAARQEIFDPVVASLVFDDEADAIRIANSTDFGFGRSSGMDALMEYTSPKSFWIDTASTPRIAFGYAPDA